MLSKPRRCHIIQSSTHSSKDLGEIKIHWRIPYKSKILSGFNIKTNERFLNTLFIFFGKNEHPVIAINIHVSTRLLGVNTSYLFRLFWIRI